MTRFPLPNLRPFIIPLVCGLGSSAFGAITIDLWDSDSLSSSSGVVSIDVDNLSSRTAAVTNSTTGETVTVTVSGENGTLNESGNPGDNLGINSPESGDVTSNIDSRTGQEGVSFSFSSAVTITALNFTAINWDGDTDYEYVSVVLDGSEITTLFSDNANESSAGFTGSTNPQAASSGDDFTLSISVAANTTLSFFHAENTPDSDSAGFQIDDITFTVVPEPTTALIGAMGFILLFRRRR